MWLLIPIKFQMLASSLCRRQSNRPGHTVAEAVCAFLIIGARAGLGPESQGAAKSAVVPAVLFHTQPRILVLLVNEPRQSIVSAFIQASETRLILLGDAIAPCFALCSLSAARVTNVSIAATARSTAAIRYASS